MNTGLFDKNGTPIKVGDKTRLVLDGGEVREFDVCFKTVTRTVKCHPYFDDEYSKVAITGVVFYWNGYDLFPCVDENGVMDTSKMEIVEKSEEVKTPRWSEEQQAYICQHCGGEVSTQNMAYGFTCNKCGMPIHEKRAYD